MAKNDPEINELYQSYIESLARATVPIFQKTIDGKSADPVGTGILISTNENAYLVSALHVLNKGTQQQPLFFFAGNNKIREIRGDMKVAPDPKDVGVLKFHGKRKNYPGVNRVSLPFSWLKANEVPRLDKSYIVLGFPSSRSNLNRYSKLARSELRSFQTSSLPIDDYNLLGINVEDFLLLDFQRKDFYLLDGQQVTFPEPHGMSGGPVWLLRDYNGANDKRRTFLVGMVIEKDVSRGKYIKCVDIKIAQDLILHHEAETAYNEDPLSHISSLIRS